MAKVIEVVGEAAEVLSENAPTAVERTYELVEIVSQKNLFNKRAVIVIAAAAVTIGALFVVSKIRAKKTEDAVVVTRVEAYEVPPAE